MDPSPSIIPANHPIYPVFRDIESSWLGIALMPMTVPQWWLLVNRVGVPPNSDWIFNVHY